MKLHWHAGNRLQLLENGEEFFPAVLDAIAGAERELLIETFILFDDTVGRDLQAAVIAAAKRGVQVDLTLDGYGSIELSPEFIGAMTEVGVRVHLFDPSPRVLGFRTNLLRRLHRKIVAIDGRLAFVGGINFALDQVASSGPNGKQDYSVRIEGPLAEEIQRFARAALGTAASAGEGRLRWHGRKTKRAERPKDNRNNAGAQETEASGQAAFVSRDNHRHRTDIEHCYRTAIRTAKDEVIIANAYFFPGYRLLRDMRRAARRGVRVQLILQGEPDMAYVRTAARLLYRSLVKDGVTVHEYLRRPLHAKVAVVDGTWATVGSSNLDPLSLSLNLEANVLLHDRAFAAGLREKLLKLAERDSRLVVYESLPEHTMWRYALGALAYHVARGFPAWLAWLPHRGPRLRSFVRGNVLDTPTVTESA